MRTVARLAHEAHLAVERVADAQIPVAVDPEIGGERRRGFQQRQERCQRQVGERAPDWPVAYPGG